MAQKFSKSLICPVIIENAKRKKKTDLTFFTHPAFKTTHIRLMVFVCPALK